MNEQKLFDLWMEKATEDADIINELMSIKANEKAIYERFFRDLEFGTGGMRGVLGAGIFRFNIYTVRKATQGLANYLNAKKKGASVAIAYDSRIKSDLFAKTAAEVLAGNGIQVHIYKELMPTPMLSFAVRHLKADGGIVITASHNPAKYNGYKVYGADGCQLTIDAADAVLAQVEQVDMFDGVKKISFEEGLSTGRIAYIEDTVIDAYLEQVALQTVNKGILEEVNLKVIYSPLNGAGNKPVRAILKKMNIKNLTVVPEQEQPDGNFPTTPFPNPEIRQVFEIAIDMAKESNPDLLLATDPDCDRVGIAVRHDSEYVLMSGNEVGVLLLDYILSQRTILDTLPQNPIAVKTIVTTPLTERVAEKYNCELIDVLTGFKFIGEQIGFLEKKGQENRYVFGFEESYGYLAGSYVRDKDAVVASMLICEMAAFYKKQGKTLVNVMEALYKEHGFYNNTLENFEFEGADGMKKMARMMASLRENTPEQIGGFSVVIVADYLNSVEYSSEKNQEKEITLPKSDVLSYTLSNGCKLIVRPSGTEPKIKVYITAKGESRPAAQAMTAVLTGDIPKLLGL